MKLVGACLLSLGGAGLGVQAAWLWGQRLRWLELLRQMIYFLKGEILYGHVELAEALELTGRRFLQRGQKLPEFFLGVSAGICAQKGERFPDIWEQELEKITAGPLTISDLEELKNLGQNLGYLDLSMQERTLLLYLEQLEESIGYLKLHQSERARLYICLGAALGLFCSIALY